jgi:hypothetical protein
MNLVRVTVSQTYQKTVDTTGIFGGEFIQYLIVIIPGEPGEHYDHVIMPKSRATQI